MCAKDIVIFFAKISIFPSDLTPVFLNGEERKNWDTFLNFFSSASVAKNWTLATAISIFFLIFMLLLLPEVRKREPEVLEKNLQNFSIKNITITSVRHDYISCTIVRNVYYIHIWFSHVGKKESFLALKNFEWRGREVKRKYI